MRCSTPVSRRSALTSPPLSLFHWPSTQHLSLRPHRCPKPLLVSTSTSSHAVLIIISVSQVLHGEKRLYTGMKLLVWWSYTYAADCFTMRKGYANEVTLTLPIKALQLDWRVAWCLLFSLPQSSWTADSHCCKQTLHYTILLQDSALNSCSH